MPDDESYASEFMHALAASEADVSNITAEETPHGVRVTCSLHNEDHWDLLQEVASNYGFKRRDDAVSSLVVFIRKDAER